MFKCIYITIHMYICVHIHIEYIYSICAEANSAG